MTLKWQISPEVLSGRIDEEVILMSVAADSYFGLDPVGSNIWEMLSKQPASVNELVDYLTEDYEVPKETCREDVQQFIDDLLAKKLIGQEEAK
jgi:hypothetical protein